MEKECNVMTKRKAARIWKSGEIYKLCEVWRIYITYLRKARRNSHIYSDMSGKLMDMGVIATPNEIRVKINNLTQKYSEKKVIGPSGGSPSTWEFFNNVHSIVGSFMSNNVSSMHKSIVFDSTISSISAALHDTSSESGSTHLSIQPSSASQLPSSPLSSALLSPPFCTTPPLASPTLASSSATPSSSSILASCAKKRQLNKTADIWQEMKRTNDLIEADTKEAKALLKRANELDEKWLKITENFMSRSLELQEKILESVKQKAE